MVVRTSTGVLDCPYWSVTRMKTLLTWPVVAETPLDIVAGEAAAAAVHPTHLAARKLGFLPALPGGVASTSMTAPAARLVNPVRVMTALAADHATVPENGTAVFWAGGGVAIGVVRPMLARRALSMMYACWPLGATAAPKLSVWTFATPYAAQAAWPAGPIVCHSELR